MSDLSPLSVVERKLDFEDVRAAVDPAPTSIGGDPAAQQGSNPILAMLDGNGMSSTPPGGAMWAKIRPMSP
jgi:hypothetical protein